MSRYIDADALIKSIKYSGDLGGYIGAAVYQIKQVAIKYIDDAPSIKTKQIKYYDEDENVWKTGSVIIDER